MTAPDPKTVREIAREAVRRGGSDSGYGFIGSVISDHAAMGEMLASGDRAAFGRLHAAVRAELKGAAITVSWPDEQQPADVVTAEQQQPSVADADTPVGRIDVWLTAWKRYFGTLGLPFGADLIAGPPPSAEPRVSADDFGVVLEVLAVVLAERARSATAEQQQDGAVGRLTAMLARLDKFGTDFPYRCEGSRVILGEILSVSVDCENGHSEPVGAGNATGEDLRAVLAERTALAARVAELESEREADTRAVLALLKLGEVLYLGQRPTDWADARRQLNARFADRIEALDATETEES